MNDIFISYNREDESQVRALVEALSATGLSVWWDRQIPAAKRWRDAILAELESARCVIVVWSKRSTQADMVLEEARRGLGRRVLLQVRIDETELPFGFGEQQALDLVDWTGDAADPRFQDIAASAKAIAGGEPVPATRPARKRRFTRKQVRKFALLVAIAIPAAAMAGGVRIVCLVPGIRGVCGRYGIGGAPSEAEQALWSARKAGDCDSLRTYIARFPQGAYAGEAQTRLAGAKTVLTETWVAEEVRLPLVVRGSPNPFPSVGQARADAVRRAPEEARAVCAGYRQGEFRLDDALAVPSRWICPARPGGFVCGFDGEAICKVRERHAVQKATCP